MHRKLNTLFVFLLIVVFITSANTTQQWNILLGTILATAFSLTVFIAEYLTLDGMFSAIVVGTYVLGLGGWPLAVVLVFFFLSSVLITRSLTKTEDSLREVRRDGAQVWANGFWVLVCMAFWVVFDLEIFIIASWAAVATATADTWATELGSDLPHATYLITDFSTVSAGTDGGISLRGTTAALAGAAAIAAAGLYVFSLHFNIFICIFTAGFLGCLLDSYFGAIFQRNNRSVTLPVWNKTISMDNNLVNGISTGTGALLAVILKLLLA